MKLNLGPVERKNINFALYYTLGAHLVSSLIVYEFSVAEGTWHMAVHGNSEFWDSTACVPPHLHAIGWTSHRQRMN